MPPVYSTRFLAQHDAPGAIAQTYTVPAGFVAVVRDVDVYYGGPSAVGVVVLGSASQVFWQASWSLAQSGWRGFRGRQVLYAEELLQIVPDDTMDISASGYLLAAS